MKIENLKISTVEELTSSDNLAYLKAEYINMQSDVADEQYDVEKLHAHMRSDILFETTESGLYDSLQFIDSTKYLVQPFVSGIEVTFCYENGELKSVLDMQGTDILTSSLEEAVKDWALYKVSRKVSELKGVICVENPLQNTVSYTELIDAYQNEDFTGLTFVCFDLNLINKVLTAEQSMKFLADNNIPSLPYRTVYLSKLETEEDLQSFLYNFRFEENLSENSSFVFKSKSGSVIYKNVGMLVYENAVLSIDYKSVSVEGKLVYKPVLKLVKKTETILGDIEEIELENLQTLILYNIRVGEPVYFMTGLHPYLCTKEGRFLYV